MHNDYSTGLSSTKVLSRGLWRRLTTIAAAAVMVVTVLPSNAGAAESASEPAGTVRAGDPTFVFEGGGFGHSVGMSQFGAYGMALEGFQWEDIMTHYFTGSSPADVSDDLADTPLWVNLTLERTSLDLTVFSTRSGEREMKVKFTLGDSTVKASVGDVVSVTRTGSGCRLTAPGGTLEGPCNINADWDGWSGDPTVGLQQGGCSLVNWNHAAGSRLQACQYARGALRIRPDNNTATFNVSLEIDIEDYVLGISEMPYFWGATGGMAALEAQAVAARSYALHRAIRRGDPETRPWCACHIYDTTLDQAYVGWGHGTQEWIDAVRSTENKVMTHPSVTWNGGPMPIETFYSSSTFGWTEASEDGFLAYLPYLRPVDDHWSQKPEVGNHNARWTKRMTGSQIGSALGMGTVQAAEITSCSTTGAALEITFTDSSTSRAFRTRDLRGRLALTSMQVFNIGSPTLGAAPCDGLGLPASESSEGGPATLIAVTIDDDAVGDSVGNADGSAQCGELIEVHTLIGTEAGTLEDVDMQISSTDPLVDVLWTPTSEANDVSSGGSTVNDNDWDLQISPDAPDGHVSTLTLVVRSRQGAWNINVPIGITCDVAAGSGSIASVGDANGNGSDDTATVTTDDEGAVQLLIEDGTSGAPITSQRIAATGHIPVDVEEIDGQVAVLIKDSERNKTYVLVIDPRTGATTNSIPFGGGLVPLDLETVPNMGRTDASELAVLVKKGPKPMAMVRDAGNGGRIATVRWSKRVTPIDLEVSSSVGGTAASELVLLARHGNGKVFAYVSDALSRSKVSKVTFARGTAATDLEIVTDGGRSLLVVSGSASGSARVAVRDAATGAKVIERTVTEGLLVDSAVVANAGGEPTSDLAMLVIAPNGTVHAVVADPITGRSLSDTVFPRAIDPVEVTALNDGRLAALGRSGGAWTQISLRAS